MTPESNFDLLCKFLTFASIIGAIFGTIYWRWYAIPISFGFFFGVVPIYGRIFIDPKIKKMTEEKKPKQFFNSN